MILWAAAAGAASADLVADLDPPGFDRIVIDEGGSLAPFFDGSPSLPYFANVTTTAGERFRRRVGPGFDGEVKLVRFAPDGSIADADTQFRFNVQDLARTFGAGGVLDKRGLEANLGKPLEQASGFYALDLFGSIELVDANLNSLGRQNFFDRVLIEIRNVAPVIAAASLPDLTVAVGQSFSLFADVFDPGNDVAAINWDFNDDGFTDLQGALLPDLTISVPGTYPVAVAAVDEDGAFDVHRFTITVAAVPEPATTLLCGLAGLCFACRIGGRKS